MFFIGNLPKHTIVFEYGKRLTQRRKDDMAEFLLEFCCEHYDLPDEHLTLKRSKQTLNNELRFGRYKEFERTERGYKTEISRSVGHGKEIVTYNVE